MFNTSKLFIKCRQQVNTIEDETGNIFPCDCLEVLKDVYKGRLDYISLSTLYNMVYALMCDICIDNIKDYEKEIKQEVNDFINS